MKEKYSSFLFISDPSKREQSIKGSLDKLVNPWTVLIQYEGGEGVVKEFLKVSFDFSFV